MIRRYLLFQALSALYWSSLWTCHGQWCWLHGWTLRRMYRVAGVSPPSPG